MLDYPPEVAELLARGAEVTWYPLADADGQIVGAVIIGVAWPLGWDTAAFRDPITGRDVLTFAAGQSIPRRRDSRPAVLPRPGPVVSPIAAQAP